ncbi:MAG: general secretion pathway protein D [Pseudohongiellaceae bacterium]|jgi:general secretion pathway protein D
MDVAEKAVTAEKNRFERLPSAAIDTTPPRLINKNDILFSPNEEATISLSVDGLPIPAFINEVYGNQLALDFEIAPAVANKKDLVTLRVTEPRNKHSIFQLSRDVLANYGVLVVKQGDRLRFILGTGPEANTEIPLILTGSALPSVPSTHRPVFLIRSLNIISNSDAYSMLRMVFDNKKLKVERDNSRNAVSLRGAPDVVKSAAEMLELFDKPNMKGRYSMRIDPVFTDAEILAENIEKAMAAQGYDIGGKNKNTTLMPIKELNALFVFAPSEGVLAAVRKWTKQFDKVVAKANREDGFYWYAVKNTSAEQLAETLNAVMGGARSGNTRNRSAGATGASKASQPVGGIKSAGASVQGDFVVDQARNMLLYRGKAERWQEIMPLIQDLDKAPMQVMVEVVVAEVRLNESMEFGIEWTLNNRNDSEGSLSALFGSSSGTLGGGGLSWTSLSSSGSTRMALNALAGDDNVSILQTPRILVRSGESASVTVGEKIPVVTSGRAEDLVDDGDTAITQQVEYRDVGISLSVQPTVYSDGRIDMVISQDVSSTAGQTLTPIIANTSLSTSLSLQDGGSVLLAGLIKKSHSKGGSRVPFLGDIPWLGQLFSSDSSSAERTELMILIVPYLIKEPGQAEALTRSFRKQLQLHPGFDESVGKDGEGDSPKQ